MAAQVKVVLLGSGDSGKSTILKQMRLIYRATFSPQETERFRQFGVGVRYPCEVRRPRMVYVHNI
ncbi:hypothetical protein DFH08DRAFT_951034 [Mycena albidolilacea]|uniref:Uncharacterized protein n=1 Tax=Mycena albidolilacea TaxID=1033008 RepID=A0AAD7AME1_9AGAR|nr:hypothetical protein DFH08DRAFT_951034 [Mycena albidolilacea]